MTLRRHAGMATYAVASTAAVAVLTRLRTQTAVPAIAIPQFTPRPRPAPTGAGWPADLPRQALRHGLLATGLALLVLAIVSTMPAWPFLQRGETASQATTAWQSSLGVTGTAASRVPQFGAATFVGQLPFIQQARFFSALTGSTPEVERFVEGARQATVAQYLQNVSTQVTLPYLRDAVAAKQAIDTWEAAQRQAQAQAAALAAAGNATWQAPPVAAGTQLASTVTFYACVGNGFCGNMANGQQVYAGAAACSTNLPMGTRFVIDNDPAQRVFTCLDRGALSPTWVDIWFYDTSDGWAWQSTVGTRSAITIIP